MQYVLLIAAAVVSGCGTVTIQKNTAESPGSTGATSTAGSTGPTGTATTSLTLTGAPATTAVAGTAYAFTPTTQNSNGAALIFNIQNAPNWASFSTLTGMLSGTPAPANAGTYSNISISVSDGTSVAVLPAFSIVVSAAVAAGTATLTWTAPGRNTDGSKLTDLSGYTIYYGNSPGALTRSIPIYNPSTTSYTVTNLATGTWYFTVTADASDGTRSAPSNVGTKTF
jgi:hypothetical protein